MKRSTWLCVPFLLSSLVNLAQTRLELGQVEAAARAAERAYTLQRETLGETHGDLAHALLALGRIDIERGNQDRARERLERSRTLAREAFGDQHFLVGLATHHLARLADETP